MTEKNNKLLFLFSIALLLVHAAIVFNSYYVPAPVVAVLLPATFLFVRFILKSDVNRTVYELLFAACVLNIPFGAGGYIYRPWSVALVAAVCILPAAYCVITRKKWWSAFRWSFIAVVTAGFFVSAYMRADIGKRCSETIEFHASASTVMMPSLDNPYGVYAAPGGCPVFSCYSMDRKIGAISCDDKPSYTDVKGNPQRMAADPGRNRIYFPQRGTPSFTVAQLKPFKVLKTVSVPGAQSLLNGDVRLSDGLVVMVDEKRHSLFALDPDTFETKLTADFGWGAAYSVAVDQQRNYAFVSDWAGGFLHRVNLENGETAERWIGLSSFSIKADSDDGLVYLTRPFRSMVAVVDAETLEVSRLLPAGYGARDIALDPARGRIVIGNYFDGTVDVVSLDTGERTARHKVGPLVRGVAVAPDTGDIYAAWTCGFSKLKDKD